jgi:hypothetical protein
MKVVTDSPVLSLLIVLIAILWTISCTHSADLSGQPEVCFEGDVLQIYTNSCSISGCHDGKGEAGPALNNYNNIFNTVVPGNPDKSASYKAIISTWDKSKMPPDQPISIDQRTIIRVWIEQGALQTVCNISKADE